MQKNVVSKQKKIRFLNRWLKSTWQTVWYKKPWFRIIIFSVRAQLRNDNWLFWKLWNSRGKPEKFQLQEPSALNISYSRRKLFLQRKFWNHFCKMELIKQNKMKRWVIKGHGSKFCWSTQEVLSHNSPQYLESSKF